MCNIANRERKQSKRAAISFVLQLCTLTIIFVILDASRMNEHIFEASKIYEDIFDGSTLLLEHRVEFGRVVEMSYYISMSFSTRRAHFRRVQKVIEL